MPTSERKERGVSPNSAAYYNKKCEEAWELIITHYKDHFNIEQIAEKVELNSFMLKKWFKKKYGVTLYECLVQIRMETAKKLLKQTGMGIIDIAIAVGYTSHTSFSDTFRREVGVPPVKWRKENV